MAHGQVLAHSNQPLIPGNEEVEGSVQYEGVNAQIPNVIDHCPRCRVATTPKSRFCQECHLILCVTQSCGYSLRLNPDYEDKTCCIYFCCVLSLIIPIIGLITMIRFKRSAHMGARREAAFGRLYKCTIIGILLNVVIAIVLII